MFKLTLIIEPSDVQSEIQHNYVVYEYKCISSFLFFVPLLIIFAFVTFWYTSLEVHRSTDVAS